MTIRRMQQRGGTAAAWITANPTLASREFGVESDTLLFKIGDGVTPWNALDYSGSVWSNIPGKPAVVAAGADEAAARAEISVLSSSEVTTAITTAFNNLIAGAPGALDTWLELTTAIQADETALGALTTLVGTKAPLASPTFTGTVAGITKAMVGLGSADNTADTAKPVSTAQQTALDGKTANLVPTAVKTSAYTAVVSDMVPVDATSGTVAITLPTAPADKARIAVKKIDASANTVTIPAGGSDVFNKSGGSTSLTLALQNQAAVLQYNASGAIWYVVSTDVPLSGLDARYQAAGSGGSGTVSIINEYNSTSSAVSLTAQALPTSAGRTLIGLRHSIIGPGASGGSGKRGAGGATRGGGGGGGGSAAVIDRWIPASLLTGTWDLNLPQSGAGGAAVTADDTNGNAGTAITGVASFSCPSGTVLSRVAAPTAGAGGTATGGTAGAASSYGPIPGGAGGLGGGAGGATTTGGAGGGAGGGGITASTPGVPSVGLSGGTNSAAGVGTAGGGGAVDSTAPTSGAAAKANIPGGGAGAGASSVTAAAQAGADATGYGGGGAGGGASLNGFNSGAGSKGGPGYARLEWVFQ